MPITPWGFWGKARGEDVDLDVAAQDVAVGQPQHVVYAVQEGRGFKPPGGGGIEGVAHDHLVDHDQQQGQGQQ